jgi:hypothetical protein
MKRRAARKENKVRQRERVRQCLTYGNVRNAERTYVEIDIAADVPEAPLRHRA